jgi:hypothetical protein
MAAMMKFRPVRSSGPEWIDPLPEQIDSPGRPAGIDATLGMALAAVFGAALAVLLLAGRQR